MDSIIENYDDSNGLRVILNPFAFDLSLISFLAPFRSFEGEPLDDLSPEDGN